MIQKYLSTLKIHKLTQEQYERELNAGRIDSNAIYLTEDKEQDLSIFATKAELENKSDKGHTHTATEIGADSAGSANKALSDAKVYTDSALTNKADKNHNHDTATVTTNGFMSADDKKNLGLLTSTVYNLGSFGGKTVADLQASLVTWLEAYPNITNASVKFSAHHDWITGWNSGNTTKTISTGGTWTVTNIAPYANSNYAQLRIAYYENKRIVYVVRHNGVWGNVLTPMFTNDIAERSNKVLVSTTNPTSMAQYRIPLRTATSDDYTSLVQDNGLYYGSQNGTSSVNGRSQFVLGNSTATGTAGNKRGELVLYGTSAGYTQIIPLNNETNSITINLPSKSGTLALAKDVLSIGGGTLTGGLNVKGDIRTYHASGGDSSIGAHYADSKALFIYGNNSTNTRGLRDTTSGDVITVTDTAITFHGKANSTLKADNADVATKASQDGSGNVITSTYETKTNATSKLVEAKAYADTAATKIKNDLLNGAGAAYDTLKELGILINENTTAIDALAVIATNKADKSHTHTIANVTNLQSSLDGKLSLNGGVMTGEIKIGQNDGFGIQLGKAGRINATATDGTTTNTIVGINGEMAVIGSPAFNMTMRGKTTRPTYNGSNVALYSDVSLSTLGITATATELNYTDGVTSNIQTQLNNKSNTGHTHTNYAPYSTISATTPATAGWYRIAQSIQGIGNSNGLFQIVAERSGNHTSTLLAVGTSYGVNASTNINVLNCAHYSYSGISKARIVYHTSYSGNYAYLEVYVPNNAATTITVRLIQSNGWSTLVNPNTAGSIPSGYSSKEVELKNNTLTGDLVGNATSANTSSGLSYNTTISTDAAINDFLEARKLKVAIWDTTSTPGVSNGILISGGYTSTNYGFQLAIDDDPGHYIALRQKSTNGWGNWKRIPMADGTGASGTWAINTTGNAATASKLATARTISLTGSITGSGSFDGSGNLSIATTTNHTHSYLPLSGGTLTGVLSANGGISVASGNMININTSVTDHSNPASQCLVINCTAVPSGTTLGMKNSPGIGFHIAQYNWASMIYDGSFKFVNSAFNGYEKVYASTFVGSLSGNATTASSATGVQDYNNTSRVIKIGYDGSSATADQIKFIAAYISDTQIKDITKSTLQSWLGLGSAAYTASGNYAISGHTHNYAGSSSAGGTANSAIKADYLSTYAASHSTNDAIECLKVAFDSVPKSVLTAVRLERGSHNMAIGWFLNGYAKANAYGGWFISEYGTPSWVGVDNGTWHKSSFITTKNIGNQSVNYANSAGSANYAIYDQNGNTINSTYLKLSGGTMNSGARISHGGSLYLGNADNSGWVYTQDIASHSGTGNWAINVGGSAWFKDVHIGGYTYTAKGSYALNTSSFYCQSWIRSGGDTGWFNETYGGGWYMTDSIWIRTYNNKSIYQNSGIMRTDGTLQVGSDGAYFNSNSSGTTIGGPLHVNNTNTVDITDNNAALVIGAKGGQHLEIDKLRIQAKENTTTAKNLYIQSFGGDVRINYNVGDASGGWLKLCAEEGTGYLASNSNLTLKATYFSDTLPGSITFRSAGYWKSASNIRKGHIFFQDAQSKTWMYLAFDTTSPYISSDAIGGRTTSGGSAIHITSGNVLAKLSSATKYKLDIQNIENPNYAYNILKLNPKTWYDKAEMDAYANALTGELEGKNPNEIYVGFNNVSLKRIPGLIAEDVEAAGLDKYCIYEIDAKNNKKEIDGISYEKIGTLLIPIVRDLTLFAQKVAPHIDISGMDDTTRDELIVLLNRINSFKESEVIK